MMEHYINKGDFYFEQNKSTFNFPLQDINVKITPNTVIEIYSTYLACMLVMS